MRTLARIQNSHSDGSSLLAAFSSRWMMLLRLAAFFLRRLLSLGLREKPNRPRAEVPPWCPLVPGPSAAEVVGSLGVGEFDGVGSLGMSSGPEVGFSSPGPSCRKSAAPSESVPSQPSPAFPAWTEGEPPSPAEAEPEPAAWISSIKSSRRIRDLERERE